MIRKISGILIVVLLAFVATHVTTNIWNALVYGGIVVLLMVQIVRDLMTFRKTRKGIFVEGKVKIVETSVDQEGQRITVEFRDPTYQETHWVEFSADKSSKFERDQVVKVWVNEKKLSKSIVVESVSKRWYISVIMSIAFLAIMTIVFVKSIK